MRPKSHFTSALSFLVLIAMVWYAFSSQTPSGELEKEKDLKEWSTKRALVHVKKLSQEPHYLGSKAHEKNRTYIIRQLEKLGLKTETQSGFTLDKYGNLSRPVNILARIEGTANNNEALVLMCHYDSDPHSSLGASDAASGIATIIEGIRAYLTDNKPENDIIILITDGEELGLNGADLFVTKHRWAKDAKMILNFEARGSGGPSYMLVETNGGNREIINAFKEAGTNYPVANSLAYSIYKKLPNDTDLTVMREKGDINGLNFAFIGDHFDYHSQLDSYERLDRNTLAHQGSYLMALLSYFAKSDLSDGLKTTAGTDDIYFPLPIIDMVSFPFSWMPILIIVSGILLIFLIFYGVRKNRLRFKDLLVGFVPFLGSLILGYLIVNYGWQAISTADFYIDQAAIFPYNGYAWIASAALIGTAITFFIYHAFYHKDRVASHSVAPLVFLWIICFIVAFPVSESGLIPAAYLPGAGFFIVPLFAGLIMLWLNIYKKRPNYLLLLIFTTPVIFVFTPFIKGFPVALGMKILFVAAVLSVLIFGLLVPVLGHYRKKHILGLISLFVGFAFAGYAFAKAEFSPTQPQKTSLIYLANADDNTAQWATYDHNLSDWTLEKIDPEKNDGKDDGNTIDSKYASRYSHTTPAEYRSLKTINSKITVDTIIGDQRQIKLVVNSKDRVDRWEVFADKRFQFNAAKINGVNAPVNDAGKPFARRRGNRLISYYVSNGSPLVMELTFEKDEDPVFEVYAASFDLLQSQELAVDPRPEGEIPAPFVLNDAIVVKKRIETARDEQ
ncbi:M28 family peptidase [Nonlabens ponticola]|uniref:Vacuolar membrane protease n=1 Tax=Nonlabens ponticola TaxID=2496866 RepID=A0A3S9MW21_9FLAO|nr:M28 family peptidase [Nonlabens ponticola]AZQ43380.1 M28 family peptidase [Nonlabens ponticola]